jgi:hypothetical protein
MTDSVLGTFFPPLQPGMANAILKAGDLRTACADLRSKQQSLMRGAKTQIARSRRLVDMARWEARRRSRSIVPLLLAQPLSWS